MGVELMDMSLVNNIVTIHIQASWLIIGVVLLIVFALFRKR